MKNLKIQNDFFIKNKFLFSLIFVLVILILIFFSSLISKKNFQNKNIIDSALVNKKYNIEKISIKDEDSTLIFSKYENFWAGEFIENKKNCLPINFPVDQKLITEFLTESKSIRQINIVQNFKNNISKSELEKIYKTFGLLENDALEVTFFNDEQFGQNEVSKIYFGALNLSKDKIFFRTQKSLTIYSMDIKILSYLETDKNFFAEKNLIPQSIFNNLQARDIQNISYNVTSENFKLNSGNEKINSNRNFVNAKNEIYEKIFSLRFSEIIDHDDFEIINLNNQFEENKNLKDFSVLNLKIFFGNGTEILLKFTPIKTKNGDCYLQEIFITPQFSLPESEKKLIKKLNYNATISTWTFNSILKMLE